ncbi:MAG: DUF3524 domain-containing protein [bacterium]|nr:DUF3524 domain-containing protein [bacterium]
MKILLIEPFYTGSHKAWLKGIQEHSRHRVSLLTMPGRYWKWRMHGGCVTLAQKYLEQYSAPGEKPNLILASDMLDLSGFLALTRKETHSIPIALYFHENQLTYPWSPTDRDVKHKRDKHYGFINYISALTADHCFYNSNFHRNSFLGALPNFLKSFPDFNETATIDIIDKKSTVLPLGIDLARFDAEVPEPPGFSETGSAPILLWNHRWEYDKNPGDFFEALYALDAKGIPFRAAILGERYGKIPKEFEKARDRLGSKIIKFGYAESFEEYVFWLQNAHILPVTSNQDFFGISIMEALYCGCVPLLPKRLTYPDLVPIEQFGPCFYNDQAHLISQLETLLQNPEPHNSHQFRQLASAYDWKNMINLYDSTFEEMCS